MKQPHDITIELKRVHVRDLKIQGHTERISWIHTAGGSVNILISQRFTNGRWGAPGLVGRLYVDEGEEQIGPLVTDYASRQDRRDPHDIPLRIRPVEKEDLRVDRDIEADRPHRVLR